MCKEAGGAQGNAINDTDDNEEDEEEAYDDASYGELTTIAENERSVMATLAGNMAFHGTTAAKFAQATKDTKASPDWTNVGTDYQTWVQTLWLNQDDPGAELAPCGGKCLAQRQR
jgi:hypothetical protein